MIYPILIAGLFDWLTDAAKGIASAILSVIGRVLASLFSYFNDFACGLIDIVAMFLPATPANLKISALVSSVGGTIPFVGKGVVSEIFITIASFGAIILAIKIYKLIPFKMT